MSAATTTLLESAGAAPAAKKSSKKWILLLSGGLLLAAAGGGASWFLMQRDKAADPGAVHEPEAKSSKKPLFTPLDAFTVNLRDADSERFAQIGVTLQLDEPSVEARVKDRLPAVRNNILLLIASKRADELLSAEGKQQLASQIAVQAALAIGVDLTPPPPASGRAGAADAKRPQPVNPVKDVLFSQFIVQ